MRILFCKVPWMKYYQGIAAEGVSVEDIAADHKHGFETMNFLPISVMDETGNMESELLLGYYETKTMADGKSSQTKIQNINGCSHFTKEALIDNVLVVWCANKNGGATNVVGWYKDATVFRNYQSVPINLEDGTVQEKLYNIIASAEDVLLLPESERDNGIWNVPHKNSKKGNPFGFYRSNVWYADETEAREFIKDLLYHIEHYSGKNGIYKEEE